MMKSEFFQLLLHENIINCMKKVKKKTSNNENKERLSFILGAIFFGISIYLCFAFIRVVLQYWCSRPDFDRGTTRRRGA